MQEASSMMGSTGGPNKSTMLEQEMKAIRRMKQKQQREIEAIVDYEVKMQQIREKNEANIRAQKEREARHLQELYLRRQEQEQKKQAGEEKRKEAYSKEQAAMRARMEAMKAREEANRRKLEEKERRKLREMQERESQKRAKLAEKQADNLQK